MSIRILFTSMLIAAIVGAAGSSGCGPKKETVKTAPAAAPAPTNSAAPAAAPTAKTDVSNVSVSLAAEHVPAGLKAGDKVTIQAVMGKTVGPNGITAYRTSDIASNATVVSVKHEPKPATPEQAFTVVLAVTKEQAAKIDEYKAHLVSVMEKKPDGTVAQTRKPVPLRVVLSK